MYYNILKNFENDFAQGRMRRTELEILVAGVQTPLHPPPPLRIFLEGRGVCTQAEITEDYHSLVEISSYSV